MNFFKGARSKMMSFIRGHDSAQDRASPYPRPKGRLGRAQVAVVTIIGEEFTALKETLLCGNNIPETNYFVSGSADNKDLDVVLSKCMDRSNLPCATAVRDVIDDFRPQILLLVGIAGGLCDGLIPRDGIGLGDVVIADFVHYVEFLKITERGISLRHYPCDHPSFALRKNVATALQEDFKPVVAVPRPDNAEVGPKVFLGPIVAAEKVMGGVHDPVQIALLKPFDKALAVDMESWGMATKVYECRSSFWYHPRYAIIRGISDLVGPAENNATRTQWKVYAANAAAVVAREFIKRLPVDTPQP